MMKNVTNDSASGIREIIGNGNCLFRAVSFHLYDTQAEHTRLRAEVVKWIRRNWKEHKYHISNEQMGNQKTYRYTMRQDQTYRTSVEMLALSEVYKMNVNIYVVNKRPRYGKFTQQTSPTRILVMSFFLISSDILDILFSKVDDWFPTQIMGVYFFLFTFDLLLKALKVIQYLYVEFIYKPCDIILSIEPFYC